MLRDASLRAVRALLTLLGVDPAVNGLGEASLDIRD